jgi:hypothetical protein
MALGSATGVASPTPRLESNLFGMIAAARTCTSPTPLARLLDCLLRSLGSVVRPSSPMTTCACPGQVTRPYERSHTLTWSGCQVVSTAARRSRATESRSTSWRNWAAKASSVLVASYLLL